MKLSKVDYFFVVMVAVAVLITGASFCLQGVKTFFVGRTIVEYNNPIIKGESAAEYVPPQKLSNPPAIIKAVYVTGYSAGSKKYLNYLSNLFKTTQINAVVVDIKDYSGLISYNSGALDAKKYNLYNNAIPDIDALVRFFHGQNIYVIGRVANFEDPAYSKARPDLAIYDKIKTTDLSKPVLWEDDNGLSWLDPSSKEVWGYNVSIAKDALYHGFDEINFDYIRFPTDGKMDDMGFPVWDGKTPKATVIKGYFQYVRTSLYGEKISADLFGQTTINNDDMGIGQVIENAYENFDYVSPMVYPSHYANNFMGFANPAEHPYEIIKYSMDSALKKENVLAQQGQVSATTSGELAGSLTSETSPSVAGLIAPSPMSPLAKLRPWLQDFNIGADYTAQMVGQEIKATQDSLGGSYEGFMLWSPSNIYTQDALRVGTN